jgi:hypothetical protein
LNTKSRGQNHSAAAWVCDVYRLYESTPSPGTLRVPPPQPRNGASCVEHEKFVAEKIDFVKMLGYEAIAAGSAREAPV